MCIRLKDLLAPPLYERKRVTRESRWNVTGGARFRRSIDFGISVLPRRYTRYARCRQIHLKNARIVATQLQLRWMGTEPMFVPWKKEGFLDATKKVSCARILPVALGFSLQPSNSYPDTGKVVVEKIFIPMLEWNPALTLVILICLVFRFVSPVMKMYCCYWLKK